MAKQKKKQTAINPTPALEQKLGYKFGALRVVEYSGYDADDLMGQELKLNFEVRINFGIALEPTPAIVISPEITCSLLDNPERRLCFLKINTVFPVEGLDAHRDGNKISLPPEFMGTLINLAIGTARGILYAKNFGTMYGNSIIPPMNIQDLLPKEPFLTLPDGEGFVFKC
jgi:hypothetical protein